MSYIPNISRDTSPKLGGDLDVVTHDIVSTSGNNDIKVTPHGTGNIVLDGLKWPQADGSADQVLKTDGVNQLGWTTVSSGGGSAPSFGPSAWATLLQSTAVSLADGSTDAVFSDSDLHRIYEINNDRNLDITLPVVNASAPTYGSNQCLAGTQITIKKMSQVSSGGTSQKITLMGKDSSDADVKIDELTTSATAGKILTSQYSSYTLISTGTKWLLI